jgi:coenzyme F420-reducing hydrogenase gamma subunit
LFTRTLNGFGQWSNKILLLHEKKKKKKKREVDRVFMIGSVLKQSEVKKAEEKRRKIKEIRNIQTKSNKN